MSNKRGVVSRADLLKTLDDPDTARWMADRLCLVQKVSTQTKFNASSAPFFPMANPFNHTLTNLTTDTVKPETVVQPTPKQRPKTNFWYLASRGEQAETNEQESEDTDATIDIDFVNRDWQNRPKKAPKHQPLKDESGLIAKLKAFLVQPKASRKVDLAEVVNTLSRAKHLSKIPKKTHKRQERHLHIIDDRSRHLTPYWKDHDLAKLSLFRECQQENISFSVLAESESRPQQLTAQGLDEWHCPANSLVIVYSDLGTLQRYSRHRLEVWKQLGQKLRQQQCEAVAILPCSVHQVATELHGYFQRLSWEDDAASTNVEDENHLLTCLSPCIRVEPGLLRELRHKLQLPASIESTLWQSLAFESAHSVAAMWHKEFRDDYLRDFAKLDEITKQLALNTIRAWRQPLHKQVWFEEVTTVSDMSLADSSIRQDVEQARRYFIALNDQFQSDAILKENPDTQAWYRRLWKRLPESCQSSSPTLQRLAERVHQKSPSFDPKGINPQHLPESDEPLTDVVLYQRGNALYLKVFEPFQVPERGYSRLALLKLRHRFVQLRHGERVLGSLKLDEPTAIPLTDVSELTVKSDQETLNLKTLQAPDNLNIGRDGQGLYADIEFNGVDQRFRYIEPGSFMMGSPKDEIGRFEYETLHRVTLTKGYWLADTACTQSLWQAVMSENPSEFLDNPENPVEKVSWNRVQEFFSAINKLIPGLTAHLPKEVEWEYACRAGSRTPFNFEGELHYDRVNYRGLWDAEKDIRGEYKWHPAAKRKTVAVKHYQPNEWGLYEMHGNVLEWCADSWRESLDSKPVVDPYEKPKPLSSGGTPDPVSQADTGIMVKHDTGSQSENAHQLRVLRGGSWGLSGWLCRSAIRSGYDADVRDSYIGFRFSLGLELKPSAASRSGLSEADSKRVAEQRVKAVQSGRAVMSTDPEKVKGFKEMNEFMTQVRGTDQGGWSPDSDEEPLAERIAKGFKKMFGRKK